MKTLGLIGGMSWESTATYYRLLNEHAKAALGGLHQQGKATSTNPIASIFAWTGGLKHRAKLDNTPEVAHFAETLEHVIVHTVESGRMTKDLAMLVGPDQAWLDTEGFMNALDENLAKALAE